MVTFVGSDVGGGNVGTITDLVWPTVQNDDVALVLWEMVNTVTPTIPSGWTVPTGGSVDSTTGSGRYRFMWHACDGTESGALNLTNSGAVVNRQSAALVVYRGLDASNPIDQLASRLENTAGTTHASPSVTTGVTDAVVWVGCGERSTTGTNGWTPPSSPFNNERADSTTAATGSGGTVVACADDGLGVSRSSGTTVTPGVWTSTNGFSTANVVTWTVSLAPLVVATSKPPQLVSQYGSYF